MLAPNQLIKIEHTPKPENVRSQSICHEKPILRPNYMRYVHDCGVRKGDNILVVGQVCDAALKALAKCVGNRGSLVVVDSDTEALDAIDTKASSATYTYFQPLHNVDPAVDFRPMSSRDQPVRLQTHLLETNLLPFSAETFDMVWIASLPKGIQPTYQAAFHTELKRVTKNRGRFASLTIDENHLGIDTTPSISLQITYL